MIWQALYPGTLPDWQQAFMRHSSLTRKEAAWAAASRSYFLVVTFCCAIIFLVNRSPSTVSW
jgi:hypothetical protein